MAFFRTMVRRPVLTTMLVMVLVVMGFYSYTHLVVELMPRIDFPVIVVTTAYPGAAPGEVETQVTRKLEDQISTLANIEDMSSESMENLSQIVVQFALETDQDQAAIDVEDKVDAVLSELPEDTEDPIITKFDLAGAPVVDLAVTGPRSLRELYELVDLRIQDRLSRVDGVAAVDIVGGQQREVRVTVASERLRPHGLTLLDVLQVLAAGNVNVPVGHITRGAREFNVRMQGEVATPAELGRIRVPIGGGATIPLSEVAEIHDTAEELRERSTFAGEPVVSVAVKKRSDGNTVAVVDGVMAALAELRGELPDDIAVDVVQESATFVRASVRDTLGNIGLGILLTGGLLFLFLHDWRLTVIAAVAMPVSVIAAFMLMEAAGFTVNVISLMALGICIGTLVTNSIVVLENIARLVQAGVEPEEAAARGTAEVAIAVVASTLTNVVVFTPIAFMSGIMGRIFVQFGLTVVFATIFSLVVSFTLVPMLGARLVRPGRGIGRDGGRNPFARAARAWDRAYGKLEGGYRDGLAHCLDHRWQPLLVTVLVLAGSLTLFGWVGGTFMPDIDQGRLQISLEFPAGTSLERSSTVAERLARALQREPEVTGVLVKAGGEDRSVEDVALLVTLVPKEARPASMDAFLARIRPLLARVPDARISASPVGGAGIVEADVVLEVVGEEQGPLARAGAMVLGVVEGIPGLVDVQSSERVGKPEIQITPRREHLAQHALSAGQVGRILRTAYEGEEAGVYREGGEEYDVVVQLAESARQDPTVLGDLPLATPAGRTVPLTEVMAIARTRGDARILHTDKLRLVEVTANIGEGSLSEKRARIDARLAALDLPAGVRVQYGGSAERQDEAFLAIFEALVLAIVLLYIVLAAILESFVHPLTVMATLPLSLIGMAWSLFFTGETINIMSLMALVMMVGIVVNNAILMLDQTAQERARGRSIGEALLIACPLKLRPIIMANLAIAIGMVPQAVGGGSGSEFRVPMAVVQIGGVVFSTVFTVFVIPVVYTLVDGLSLDRLRSRGGPAPAPASGGGEA